MPVIQEKQWDLWYRRSRDTHVGISPSSYLDNIRSAQAIAADCIGNEEIIYG
ncbi:hypothetical protein [Bradyrhizobium sp. AZCC 1578]|uniref:hypothetical protein n=1 Tax=Bradyrhizobium sp. AZCC 1578 TaxID=3117027 RepID=UPI002FF2DB89